MAHAPHACQAYVVMDAFNVICAIILESKSVHGLVVALFVIGLACCPLLRIRGTTVAEPAVIVIWIYLVWTVLRAVSNFEESACITGAFGS
jgi:hypothetical membrane protein